MRRPLRSAACILLSVLWVGCGDLVRTDEDLQTQSQATPTPEVAIQPAIAETPLPVLEETPAPEISETPIVAEEAVPEPVATPTPTPFTGFAPQSYKIVTWNLEWFPGKKPDASEKAVNAHISQVESELRRIKPDVLLVQEVRDADSVEKAVSVLEGFHVHIVSRFKLYDKIGDQQLGIASRFPADSAFAEEWKRSPHRPPRGFSFAALELPNRTILLTYAVHLKSNRGEDAEQKQNIAMREESARQLIQHVADMEQTYRRKNRKTAVVIGGDFNLLEKPAFKDEQTVGILKSAGLQWGFEGVPLSRRISWPPRGSFEGASFDHFFTRSLGTPTANVLRQTGASDHCPVELMISPPK